MNPTSTVLALTLGPNSSTLVDITSIAALSATISTSVNLSSEAMEGNVPIFSIRPTSILVNTIFSAASGVNASEIGNLSGYGSFGSFSSFPINIVGAGIDEKINK